MATLGPMALTLMDWAKRIDDDGKIAEIINLLSQTNEILEDMLWVEGNLPTGHKTTIRTGLPQAYWRLLNQGVPRGKSTTAQITETCGMLETYSDIDVDLVALAGNDRAFRLSEELAFLEGMNQQMAGTIFYNNITSIPAAFMGLAPRYPSVSTSNAQTANNVIDAGGTAAPTPRCGSSCGGQPPSTGYSQGEEKPGLSRRTWERPPSMMRTITRTTHGGPITNGTRALS